MKKKKIILSIIAIAIALLSLFGVSYAYYKANVKNINQTGTVLKSKELGLIYTGIEEITAGNMIPGDSFEKTFSVENISDTKLSYNIYMENIINEFNEDLVYTLTDENGIVIEERELPVTKKKKKYLKTDINIEAKEKQNYTLKIEYKYLNTVQNADQGATFSATLGIDAIQNADPFKDSGTIRVVSQYDRNDYYQYRDNITKIIIENELIPKENAAYTYDVSKKQDGSVMSYLITNENPETYTLYLQGQGGIKANKNSSFLFFEFLNLIEIEGLEYLDTSEVTNRSNKYVWYVCKFYI